MWCQKTHVWVSSCKSGSSRFPGSLSFFGLRDVVSPLSLGRVDGKATAERLRSAGAGRALARPPQRPLGERAVQRPGAGRAAGAPADLRPALHGQTDRTETSEFRSRSYAGVGNITRSWSMHSGGGLHNGEVAEV